MDELDNFKQFSSIADSYLKSNEKIIKASQPLTESVLKMVNSFKLPQLNREINSEFENIINNFSKTFLNETLVKQISATTAMMDKVVKQITFPYETVEAFTKSFERYNTQTEECVSILFSCGWPPLMRTHPSQQRQIIKEYNDDKNKFKIEIDDAIVNFHDNEILQEIIDNWSENAISSDRIHILYDAFEAHKKGLYYSSIPTFLSQIEGILAELNQHEGHLKTSQINSYLDALFDDNSPYAILRGKLFDELYTRFRWGDEIPTALSRHAILHGANKTYGTEKNSLKVILFLDLIICFGSIAMKRNKK